MKRDLIRIQNGYCRHNRVLLLKDIQIALQCGEIQGVFFENHTDEEHLINILSGAVELDGGQIWYKDTRIDLKTARKQFREKVFLPMFKNQWAKDLTVVDFFCLDKKQFYFKRRECEKKIYTLGEIFGLEMQPQQRMYRLTESQRVQLELIRAYERGYEAVILRGLSAIIGEKAWPDVGALLNQLRARDMAVLILDHVAIPARFSTADIYEISQGQTVYIYRKDELMRHLYRQAQQPVWEPEGTLYNAAKSHELLQINDVRLDDKVTVNLTVNDGEMVTVLDTRGNYVDQLTAILRGNQSPGRGGVRYRGISLNEMALHQKIRWGIGFIEERERKQGQELYYHLSVVENIELLLAEKSGNVLMKKKQRQSIIRESAEFFSEQEMLTPVAQLEPWQQQRVLYYRWYLFYPQLIVCIRPLSSLDLQMRKESERMIRAFRERGIAVLILTANAMTAETIGGRQICL